MTIEKIRIPNLVLEVSPEDTESFTVSSFGELLNESYKRVGTYLLGANILSNDGGLVKTYDGISLRKHQWYRFKNDPETNLPILNSRFFLQLVPNKKFEELTPQELTHLDRIVVCLDYSNSLFNRSVRVRACYQIAVGLLAPPAVDVDNAKKWYKIMRHILGDRTIDDGLDCKEEQNRADDLYADIVNTKLEYHSKAEQKKIVEKKILKTLKVLSHATVADLHAATGVKKTLLISSLQVLEHKKQLTFARTKKGKDYSLPLKS